MMHDAYVQERRRLHRIGRNDDILDKVHGNSDMFLGATDDFSLQNLTDEWPEHNHAKDN